MRPVGLRLRILLTLLVPLGIFAPVTVAVVVDAIDRVVAEHGDTRGRALASQIGAVVADEIITGERYAAERDMVDVIEAQPDVEYAFVVDDHDRVVAHTFRGGFPLDLLEAHRRSKETSRPILVGLGRRQVHDLKAPILGGAAGYVHVGMSNDRALRLSEELMLRLSLIGLGVILTGAYVTFVMSGRLARRVRRVTEAAETIGEGNLDTRVGDPAEDDVGRLGKAFDRMARRLRAARDEREQTFQRLARSERLVATGQLAAGVAHEVNNPLSGVLHCVEALEADDRSRERRAKYYSLVKDGVQRAQRVVRQLLELSRSDTVEAGPLDVPRLVERVLSLLSPAMEAASVAATVSVEPDLPEIRGDAQGLEQVLLNLLLNAVDALPGGGEVSVDVRRVGPDLRIRVADDGVGMDGDQRAHAFDPFFTTKGGARGTGLGLSVSLGIVERHGGRIDIDSEPGRGTTVDVVIPMEAP